MHYCDLLDSILPTIAEPPATQLPGELELQALWFAGAFGRDFTDQHGKPVRITQFGGWNRCAGPDFLHAVIEHDGTTRHGALEIDTDPADWENHGHGADPAFNEVILHVVFRQPHTTTFTRNHDHREIPRVLIPPDLIESALQRPTRDIAIARPGRCIHPLSQLSSNDIASMLREAARHRAKIKATRWLQTADAHGRDAALFQATAETLGYRANALPMRLLAQRMPLATLREHPGAIHALLFGAAGFLTSDLHQQAPPDTRQQLRELWDIGWKLRTQWESQHPIPWQLHGQRPANHPHRRVAALAALVQHWPTYRRRALSRPFHPKPLLQFLNELADPFWSHRHTLTSNKSRRPIAIFGKTRAIELLANHLIPLAFHEDDSFTFDQYLKLPAPTRNEKVTRAAIRLFGSESAAAPWLKKAAHHQALLQIYHDFCLEDLSDCHQCPFPEQLTQWRSS